MRLAVLAKEPHESTKRQPVDRVFRAAPGAKGKRTRRIADAEFIHFHFEHLGSKEVPQFMDDDEKNEDAEDEQYSHNLQISICNLQTKSQITSTN